MLNSVEIGVTEFILFIHFPVHGYVGWRKPCKLPSCASEASMKFLLFNPIILDTFDPASGQTILYTHIESNFKRFYTTSNGLLFFPHVGENAKGYIHNFLNVF